MTHTKTKSFKHTLVGERFYCSKHDIDTGQVGCYIETLVEKTGLEVNRSAGVDLLEYNVEIKSRYFGSTAAITIGKMSQLDIINTPYRQSAMFKKLQQVRVIEYKFYDYLNEAYITDDRVYDFSEPEIQSWIEEEYERGRAVIATFLPIGRRPIWWEQKSTNSYAFRLPPRFWQRITNRVLTKPSFDLMFSWA